MELKLNLATRPYINRRLMQLVLSTTAVLLAIILLLNIWTLYARYRDMQLLDQRSAEIERRVESFQSTGSDDFSAEAFALILEEILLANKILEADSFHWTGLLDRLEQLLPDAVSIVSIQPKLKDGGLSLNGKAKNVAALTLFLDRLLESPDFNSAYLLRQGFVEAKDKRGSEEVSFSLVIEEAF